VGVVVKSSSSSSISTGQFGNGGQRQETRLAKSILAFGCWRRCSFRMWQFSNAFLPFTKRAGYTRPGGFRLENLSLSRVMLLVCLQRGCI
jgi:hypothetical protein